MMRLKSDLLPLLLAACQGRLHAATLAWEPTQSTPGGDGRQRLPRQLRKGQRDPRPGAGGAGAGRAAVPRRHRAARGWRTGGHRRARAGRRRTGPNLRAARDAAYAAIARIDWPGGFCAGYGYRAL
jgi:phosphoribosylamine--glycine ligase